MTEKTAEQLLNEFVVADKELVDSFYRDYSWTGHARIEAQLQFLSTRLLLTTSALSKIARKLIDEQKHTRGTP
jgi:hypothetical protein